MYNMYENRQQTAMSFGEWWVNPSLDEAFTCWGIYYKQKAIGGGCTFGNELRILFLQRWVVMSFTNLKWGHGKKMIHRILLKNVSSIFQYMLQSSKKSKKSKKILTALIFPSVITCTARVLPLQGSSHHLDSDAWPGYTARMLPINYHLHSEALPD